MPLHRHSIVLGLLSLGVFIRLAIWYLIPETRFASDEDQYYRAGVSLATTGGQDIFLPPLTGWLIAILKTVFPAVTLGHLRLFWVSMDLSVVFLVWRLTTRIVSSDDSNTSKQWLAGIVAAGYILYVPAISYSEFITSETPAVLLVLGLLVVLTGKRPNMPRLALAGLLTGCVVLTRTNLAGLLITIPIAIAILSAERSLKRRVLEVAVFVCVAWSVVGLWAFRNYHYEGLFSLSTNSYYNLYIGNSAIYQEDLNLFSPPATPEQIAFRRQVMSGVYPEKSLTVDQMRRAAFESMAANKALFLRRALGRLARIFVPRTDQLELLGGERQIGAFSAAALWLMIVANFQWAIILFCGVAGLLTMRGAERRVQVWFLATILGSIPLCLIAISKPRYSFVFEPLLIISACLFLSRWKRNWQLLKHHKYLYAALVLFFVWSWVAWTIFAFSSRISLI